MLLQIRADDALARIVVDRILVEYRMAETGDLVVFEAGILGDGFLFPECFDIGIDHRVQIGSLGLVVRVDETALAEYVDEHLGRLLPVTAVHRPMAASVAIIAVFGALPALAESLGAWRRWCPARW